MASLAPLPVHAQAGPAPAAPGDELIVTIRANGVDRGEFNVIRTPAGDVLILERDAARLALRRTNQAPRQVGTDRYLSLRDLGATRLDLDIAELRLDAEVSPDKLEPTRIDLSSRPKPLDLAPPGRSAILNYRATVRDTGDQQPMQLRMTSELAVRSGPFLFRQEAQAVTRSGPSTPGGLARGVSQLIVDDRLRGTRLTMGDNTVFGGNFGTTFTGAGVTYTRLFTITPDVIRQPLPSFRVFATAPSNVEIAVDGSPVYRTQVGPGPVDIDNLLYWGGSRNVRVTVTDASGRRQVIDQPYLFTDTMLGVGLHEFSYFAGHRSELGPDFRFRYREPAWQAIHRYGAADRVTLEAGGEGGKDFASGGAGAILKLDRVGLVSFDRLASTQAGGPSASGWSARYTWVGPNSALFVSRRLQDADYRSFANAVNGSPILSESRAGFSTRISQGISISGDATRTQDALGRHDQYAVRATASLTPQSSLQAEYMRTLAAGTVDKSINFYLRFNLERQGWVSSTLRSGSGTREIDVDAGRLLSQGEGVGWRVGTQQVTGPAGATSFTFGSANWNLRPFSLEFNGSSQVEGGRARFFEAGISGALVAVPGYVGATRQVPDSFAVARLGIAQAGVDVYLNNLNQGKTDSQGNLLIPQVGAFGRQDISLDDKQLPLQFELSMQRVTIAPDFRSGTVVDFGGHKVHAFTGVARLQAAGRWTEIASKAFSLQGAGREIRVETSPGGEFYIDGAAPGSYSGQVELDGKQYVCRIVLPESDEAVQEIQEGVRCE